MVINGKKLDDVKVTEARKIFERHRASYGEKGKLTFDQMLYEVTEDCNSLANIARKHGVSPQMMSQHIYPQFRKLLPGKKDGRQRQKIGTIKRLAVAAREIPNEDILAFIMQEATRRGYSVKRVQINWSKPAPSFHKWRVILRGKLYLLHHLKSVSSFGAERKQKYGRLNFAKYTECAGRIVITDFPDRPRKLFIFPAKILSGIRMLYMPADKIDESYRNCRASVNVWLYENAWHLTNKTKHHVVQRLFLF